MRVKLGAGIAKMVRAKRLGIPHKPGRKDGGIPTKPAVPCKDVKEAVVLEECMSWLIRHRCGAWRMNVTAADLDGGGIRQFGIKGAGDILACYNGRYIEIECKRGRGGILSTNQQRHREQVLRYGGLYLVIHGVEELEFFMEKVFLKRG
jgi:hypothetical protein